jgi:hypothetical protein
MMTPFYFISGKAAKSPAQIEHLKRVPRQIMNYMSARPKDDRVVRLTK